MGWHFWCLQGKKQGRALRRRSKKGRRKREGVRRRIRQPPTRLTRLTRPHADARVGCRPSSREARLEEGTNQSREPAGRWNQEGSRCETNDVTRANSGGWAAQLFPGRAESGDKIK